MKIVKDKVWRVFGYSLYVSVPVIAFYLIDNLFNSMLLATVAVILFSIMSISLVVIMLKSYIRIS